MRAWSEDWRTRGYVLVSHLLDDVWENAEHAMRALFPPDCHGTQFGGKPFPTCTALDDVTLHPNILAFARHCLGDCLGDVLLTQSEAWCKTTPTDQRMHMDFGNHSFTRPPTQPECVAAIVYFDDVQHTGGATAVVPFSTQHYPKDAWTRMPGIGTPFANDRAAAEVGQDPFRQALYDAEIHIQAKKGDVLFYRHDVWHRGTPVFQGKSRRVLNLVFKTPDAHHIYTWSQGFARNNYHGRVERMVRALTDDQRRALGIPKGRCRL